MSRDLAMREQELEERMLTLTDRERALKEKERAALSEPKEETTAPKIVAPAQAPASTKAKSLPPPAIASFRAERTEPVDVRAPSPIVSAVEDVSDEVEETDDVEEIEDIEPLGTHPGRVRVVTDDEELVDPDEVAEEVDPDALLAR